MNSQVSKRKQILKTLLSLYLVIGTLALPIKNAHAQNCDGYGTNENISIAQIVCPVVAGINALVLTAGAGCVIVLFYSSIKYATSQGDPKGALGAKMTLTYAIYGLLVIVFLYVILNITATALGVRSNLKADGVFGTIQSEICNIAAFALKEGRSIGGC